MLPQKCCELLFANGCWDPGSLSDTLRCLHRERSNRTAKLIGGHTYHLDTEGRQKEDLGRTWGPNGSGAAQSQPKRRKTKRPTVFGWAWLGPPRLRCWPSSGSGRMSGSRPRPQFIRDTGIPGTQGVPSLREHSGDPGIPLTRVHPDPVYGDSNTNRVTCSDQRRAANNQRLHDERLQLADPRPPPKGRGNFLKAHIRTQPATMGMRLHIIFRAMLTQGQNKM
jgi:hypothetical protein